MTGEGPREHGRRQGGPRVHFEGPQSKVDDPPSQSCELNVRDLEPRTFAAGADFKAYSRSCGGGRGEGARSESARSEEGNVTYAREGECRFFERPSAQTPRVSPSRSSFCGQSLHLHSTSFLLPPPTPSTSSQAPQTGPCCSRAPPCSSTSR
jgi:hypothetical protein